MYLYVFLFTFFFLLIILSLAFPLFNLRSSIVYLPYQPMFYPKLEPPSVVEKTKENIAKYVFDKFILMKN